MNLFIVNRSDYLAIKLDCSKGNIGLISAVRRQANGQTCCYFNINNKGMKTELRASVLGNISYQKQDPGTAKGVRTGSGWVAYIEFEDQNAAINWLRKEGFCVEFCPAKSGQNKGKNRGKRIPEKDVKIATSFSYLDLGFGLVQHVKQGFGEFYRNLIERFKGLGCYCLVKGQKVEDLIWPENFGVYVVRRGIGDSDDNAREILYVGMTGKFKRDGLLPKNGGLKAREVRTSPYCFTNSGPYKDYFEFAPKVSVEDLNKIQDADRYGERCKLVDLEIDCFLVERSGDNAPAFLEAFILQVYLKCFKKLPKANNAF